MIICCNTGNSSANFAAFPDDDDRNEPPRVLARFAAPASIPAIRDSKTRFCEWIKSLGADTNNWKTVIGSVAPSDVTRIIRELLKQKSGTDPLVLDSHSLVPFPSLYTPGKAGIDRLANVAGAIRLGKKPAIIVDAGTAITLEVVTEPGEFAGGSILAGPRLATEALTNRAAHLPAPSLSVPESATARDTEQAILSGTAFGLAGAIDRLIDMSRAEMHTSSPPAILFTGGYAAFFSDLSRHQVEVIPDLTLIGLCEIARKSGRL